MNKLSNSGNNKFIYILKCDINRPYFSIQYSANSDLQSYPKLFLYSMYKGAISLKGPIKL